MDDLLCVAKAEPEAVVGSPNCVVRAEPPPATPNGPQPSNRQRPVEVIITGQQQRAVPVTGLQQRPGRVVLL